MKQHNRAQKITKAVFPVAGLGTRFLPATKASPKEMLPIVDKPLIQYAVEEALQAGITDLIFITGRNKRAIEDHFDKAYELETELAKNNKLEILDSIQNIVPDYAKCIYIRQSEALGLGHAVLTAKSLIANEPFVVILADELIDADVYKNPLLQMLDVYNLTNSSVLGLATVDSKLVSQYGIVNCEQLDYYLKINDIVEKPAVESASSNIAVVGRYILTPSIMSHLSQLKSGITNEIQLTDALASLLNYEDIYGHIIQGNRFDCGSKLGYLQATVNYGLKHNNLSKDFKAFLANLL